MNRQLDADVAEKFLKWGRYKVPPDGKGENGGNEILVPPDWGQWLKDGYDLPKLGAIPFFFLCPQFSASIEKAWTLIDQMNARGVEVLIGIFPQAPNKNRYCLELRRWRDRRLEGVPGDPHTGRSRETFKLIHGDKLPEMICEAAIECSWRCKS